MTMPFAVTKHDDGDGSSRLVVLGEIDEDSGESLLALILNAAEQNGVTELVVDLRHTSFLAAAGVRVLLRGLEVATARGLGYRVGNAHGIVREVLDVTGVAGMLAVTSWLPGQVKAPAP